MPPSSRKIKIEFHCLVLAIAVLGQGCVLPGRQRALEPVYPGPNWERVDDPGSIGCSTAKLDALRATLARGQTTGVVIVVGGRVAFEYGDTSTVSYIASARKSLVSMLFGKYVASGKVSLRTTLRELGLDDKGGLLPGELEATVGDLLSARSGVYHQAANLGDASARAPARGSVEHGAYFLYNNWDFNALGAILERVTGRSIYEIFTTDLADPLELQDWKRDRAVWSQWVRNDTGLSIHPAHHFGLSTRDMARLGYLMLREGKWKDREVIPASWVRASTALVTPAREVARTSPFIDGLGYGYLWWVFDPEATREGLLDGAYTASGAYGQYITVIPGLDMVVAHKTEVPPPRNVTNETYFGTILPRILEIVSPSP